MTAGISPAVLEGRHPSTRGIALYFNWGHLTGRPRAISTECGSVAELVISQLPDGPELTAGLRKLLEAKDCFVRAALPAPAADTEHQST